VGGLRAGCGNAGPLGRDAALKAHRIDQVGVADIMFLVTNGK